MVFLVIFVAKLIYIVPGGKRGECGDDDVGNVIRILQCRIAKEGLRGENLLLACCEVDIEKEKGCEDARNLHRR